MRRLLHCRDARRAWVLVAVAMVGACAEREPPGAEPRPAPRSVIVAPAGADASAATVTPASVASEPDPVQAAAIGTRDDNLPFEPTGEKLGSIAWRTWVYTDTGPRRTRFGYLRAGAIVDRRGPEIKNAGCAGGWYRINPRGFVCIGKGATLDLGHPVLEAAAVRPKRGEGLPYVYALSDDSAPHLYFRLPKEKEMKKVEGGGFIRRAANWRARAERTGLFDRIGAPAPPPDFLAGARLQKPYGVEKRLQKTITAGRASSDSGFAVQRIFEWENRVFGLTTELDIIALDRTKVAPPSSLRGVALGSEDDLPVAFITKRWALRYEKREDGQLDPKGTFEYRQGLNLTGKQVRYEGVKFWEADDGSYVPSSSALIIKKRTSFPSVAHGTRKWIDVSIRDQTLVAYEGRRAVYATLVSTGRGGMGDPEKIPATVRGTFMIHAKHVSSTMDGEEDDVSDSFNLRDVPFVQYFHKGYALHGTYWHDEFGRLRSHGCINLAPVDSAWLFEWTDPRVPEGWHAVINKSRGTVVNVRR